MFLYFIHEHFLHWCQKLNYVGGGSIEYTVTSLKPPFGIVRNDQSVHTMYRPLQPGPEEGHLRKVKDHRVGLAHLHEALEL